MTEQRDTPVIEYGTARRANHAAVASLAFGLMLFVPLLTGVAAIILGRRGMRIARDLAIGRYGVARAGFILGVINATLWSIIGVAYGVHEYEMSVRRRCASNLSQLGLAILLYQNGHRGGMPPTLDTLVTSGELPLRSPAFTCPACSHSATPATLGTVVRSNFVLAPPFKPRFQLHLYGSVNDTLIVAYEPLSNHRASGINVLFADGHTEWLDAPAAAAVVADMKAGDNPPPSLK